MFLKLRPLLFSLIYLIGLELIVLFHRNVFSIVILLFLMSSYHGWRSGGKWRFAFLPAVFSLSSVALLYLITGRLDQQIFILLSSFMYYFSLFGAYRLNLAPTDQTARGMIVAASFSTFFFAYAGTYGLYLNFLVPLWWLMMAYVVVTFLLSYLTLAVAKKGEKRLVWLYSGILAFSMAEIIWTINYWPFGYLTSGAIALILYFVLWDIAQSHFLGILNKKRTLVNLVIFGVCVILVLITSKWTPVI